MVIDILFGPTFFPFTPMTPTNPFSPFSPFVPSGACKTTRTTTKTTTTITTITTTTTQLIHQSLAVTTVACCLVQLTGCPLGPPGPGMPGLPLSPTSPLSPCGNRRAQSDEMVDRYHMCITNDTHNAALMISRHSKRSYTLRTSLSHYSMTSLLK